MNRDRVVTVLICSVAILAGLVVKVMPSIFFQFGKTYYDKRDFVKAYSNLKKAYNLDYKNKDYRYYYVQTLTNLNPNLEVQKAMFEIATSEQDDSAKQIADNKISEWKMNVLKNIGDNYIEQTPYDNVILRWNSASFPLKINISNTTDEELPPYYMTEIHRAFAQWKNSSGFITFEETDNMNSANIIVKISKLPSNSCNEKECRYVVGFTTPTIKGHTLKHMTIILYNKDPYGNFFSDKELYNTILHELGHALGIMGHSYSSEDLMFMTSAENNIYSPYRSSFQYLSSKDINTIRLLYKLIPTITNEPVSDTKGLIYAPIILGTSKDITNRKLKEAQNYIKNAPDLASGYIDLAIAYAELNKYKEAIKAMHKGHELSKTDYEKYSTAYNLAYLYFQSNNIKDAEKYANIAKNYSQTDELKELIMQINHAKNR